LLFLLHTPPRHWRDTPLKRGCDAADGLEFEAECGGGDDVLLLDSLGHEAVVFVVEVEVERHVGGQLGAEAGDAADNVVAREVGDGGLVEGGVLDGDVVADALTCLETEGETVDLGFEAFGLGNKAVGVVFEVVDVVVDIGRADGVVALLVPEEAVFDAGEEAEFVLVALELVVVVGQRHKGRPAVILPEVELHVGGEALVEHHLVLHAVDDGVVGVESQRAVIAFDAAVVVKDGGIDVTRLHFATKTEAVTPFALCRQGGDCGEQNDD